MHVPAYWARALVDVMVKNSSFSFSTYLRLYPKLPFLAAVALKFVVF